MGKSTASCFKIISCGSDSVDHDDLQTPESKGSGDRRGWSFRKKSPKHRVLSNSVTSEAPSSVNKEKPESAAANVQAQPDLTVPEKNSVVQWADEKAELSAQVESKLAETIETVAPSKDDCGADATFDEPSVVTIQAAIRGLLAQQVLLKHKNIIKMQAAVRGHLVRRHAVGTLRCVQAIMKMQALVRERRARLNVEGSGDFVKQSESNGKDDEDSAFLNKKEAKPKGPYTYVSIDKLLSNAFARQLMESTPRSEPINIKCDPSKSDSAWQWLERWMSVSSVSNEGPEESASAVKHFDAKEDILVPSDCYSESRDFKFGEDAASIEASENDGTLIGHSELLHVIEQPNSKCDVTESAPFEMKEAELVEVVEVKSHPETEETVNEVETEQAETEVKKLSRKLSNPAFVAAQSKFEELGLAATSTKLPTSSTHDPVVEESSLYKVSSSTDEPLISSKETPLAESAVSNPPPVQIGGSECGTELSISSTLDSPDRSEAAIVYDIEKEAKVPDETDHSKNEENLQFQANGNSVVLETEPSFTNMNKLETYESTNSTFGESLDSITAADSPQLEKKKPEADPIETSHIAEEGSPRSHITVPDSQATPSSQVSVKTKKSKSGKTDSTSKRKNRATSSSADKSLANSDQDSASRNSLEHSQEQKTAKRRNSFGSAKLDNRDLQEPRDSSSSNPLPSYMQATESARAKAIANGSPRSSPDVHDKDIYIKKRHSLPGSNERQGSPRIQRSLSQAQPNAKGNAATNSPQDRKWRR